MNQEPAVQNEDKTNHWQHAVALCFALTFPTLVTLVYFQWLGDSSPFLQQTSYSIGKLIQFGFPLVWVLLFFRNRLPWDRNKDTAERDQIPSNSSWTISIVFGLVVAAGLFLLYQFLIAGSPLGERLQTMVGQKVDSMNMRVPWKFMALGLFYTLVHSFLEEYYWRWFVCWFALRWFSKWKAIVISSLGFAAHHVILLGFFLGWDNSLTYLASAAVGVGGVFWAFLFLRTNRLYECWLSHAIVDAAIFGLGYWILWGG